MPQNDRKTLTSAVLTLWSSRPRFFADPNVVIRPDNRKDYGEKRYLAFGIADGMKLCLCFTPRKGLIHLITIYKANKKDWEKNYG